MISSKVEEEDDAGEKEDEELQEEERTKQDEPYRMPTYWSKCLENEKLGPEIPIPQKLMSVPPKVKSHGKTALNI